MSVDVAPLGLLRTCFAEKFGAPRQSLMVPEATGTLELTAEHAHVAEALEGYSHAWVLFVFDQSLGKPWRPTIEPPRIDAPKRVGVLASRSPHRPNPIGLSAVRVDSVESLESGGARVHLSGVDILDRTPVLDLLPYRPEEDAIPDASGGWAGGEIRRYDVSFAPGVHLEPELRALVLRMLEWDPRPRSQREEAPIEDAASEGRRYGFRVRGYDVQWEIRAGAIHVRALYGISA